MPKLAAMLFSQARMFTVSVLQGEKFGDGEGVGVMGGMSRGLRGVGEGVWEGGRSSASRRLRGVGEMVSEWILVAMTVVLSWFGFVSVVEVIWLFGMW